MMNSNFGNNYGGMGMGYAQNQQAPVAMNQTLTKEEIDLLRKKGPKFNFKLSKEEFLRAICTHKDPATGNISLHPNADGTHTCAICGETFTLLEPNKFDRGAIEDICANFNDLFQSIKTMYGPIPAESGRELYTMIGFIPKLPDLYEISAEYFARLNGAGVGLEENRSPYGMNMLNAMMGGSPFGNMGNMGMNMNMGGGMPMGGAPVNNTSFDPQYEQYLKWQASQNQGQNVAGNTGMNVNTYQPGTPNPAYAPNNSGNAIGYVESQQTAQVGPQGAPDVKAAFKG